jgi:hypothetical protein
MNVDEGFRRVGFLLGYLGAVAGLVLAFVSATDLMNSHARAVRFQTLASAYWRVLHNHPDVIVPDPPTGHNPAIPKGYALVDPESLRKQNEALHSEGIESVIVNGRAIQSIHTIDDTTLFPQTGPFGEWLLLPILPVVGFLLPWGAVRTLTWVRRGFAQNS